MSVKESNPHWQGFHCAIFLFMASFESQSIFTGFMPISAKFDLHAYPAVLTDDFIQ
jgi:hypothetical protein